MRSPLVRVDGSRRIGIQTATLVCVLAIVVVIVVSLLTGVYDAAPGCDDILGCG